MHYLFQAIADGWRQLVSRKIYFAVMLFVPVLGSFFFLNLMSEGLPFKVPTAIVDLDHSQLSRTVGRNLASSELVSIQYTPEDYHAALELMRKGEIFGFFLIPEGFQRDAMSGKETTLSYYNNMSIFVPGTLAFKGFKSVSVTTIGGLSVSTLTYAGLPQDQAMELVSPVDFDIRGPGNPWMNYSIYLSNSFLPALIALMTSCICAFSICEEIKRGTSARWVMRAGGSMFVALLGKLIPQAVIMTAVGVMVQSLLYGFNNFPLHNHAMHMIVAMWLFVVASQWFAVTLCCIVPNLRLSLSLCSLTGILAFSIAGFSFPVEQMYGAIGIFSYILPVRYYFLIYIDQALNGIPLYFSRYYYAALLCFPLVGMLGMARLKKRCLNPVYVP